MDAAERRVTTLINENAVMVFSKSYCPYCTQTKKLLKELEAECEVLELDNDDEGQLLQKALKDGKFGGQQTVPNIFIQQQHIGGNSDIQELHKTSELAVLLKAAGAIPRD